MLVLSRRPDEVVVIGRRIRVVVVEIRGDHVRLGFEAAGDIPINREEVLASMIASGELIADVAVAKTVNTIPGQSRHPSLGRAQHDA